MINLIVCRDNNNGIGKDNKLLYHISEDLKRFKELTTGKKIIMGRKTFESLGLKPLPNRINYVLTTDVLRLSEKIYNKHAHLLDNIHLCHPNDEFFKLINKNEDIFIIGGQSIYEQFLPIADKIYLTQVYDNSKEADTFFEFDESKFELINSELHHDNNYDVDYYFKDYVRVNK